MSMEMMPVNGCGKLGEQLDAFASGEADSAGRAAVEEHLRHCDACRRDLAAIEELRLRVRSAARAVAPPPNLEGVIRARLAAESRRPQWFRPALGIAAALVLAIGASVVYQRQAPVPFHELDGPAHLAYIDRITRNLYATVSLGLKQHLHCYIARNPATLSAHVDLPAEWKALPEKLKPVVPGRFELMMGHVCHWQGRPFAHLAYRDGASRISVLITKKGDGEELPLAAALPALEREGIAMFGQSAGEYHVAAFETPGHIAYVVSDGDAAATQSLARAMAPAVAELVRPGV